MKKAFTLIELIFVIVIIGLLAAVAVPKFLNLKQSAEAANVVKTTIDAASAAVNVAVNLRDLEGKEFNLSDLVKLDGKGWSYIAPVPNEHNGSYEYNDSVTKDLIAKVTLYEANNTVEYHINCDNFSDPKTKDKCKELLGNPTTLPVEVNLTY